MEPVAVQAGVAFAAGAISFLSPCVMPMLPAYLSLVSGLSVDEMRAAGAAGGGAALRARVLKACLGFVAGFTAVFVALGVGAVAFGHVVRTWRVELLGVSFGFAQLAGVAIVAFGLHMTGLVRLSLLNRDTRPVWGGQERSLASAAAVGAGFALGWSPCIGPILSGVLALAAAGETALQGTWLLLCYSAGLAVPFLAAGASIEFFFRAFARMRSHLRTLEVVSGAVLTLLGLMMVFDQLTRLNDALSFLNDWIVALERALL